MHTITMNATMRRMPTTESMMMPRILLAFAVVAAVCAFAAIVASPFGNAIAEACNTGLC